MTVFAQGDAGAEKIRAIDCLRGYAIILVLLSHAFAYIPGLIWPVKRLLLMGIYGVQLFFIASALTLMMSWSRSQGPLWERGRKFLIRRFFRIAPLYYLAIPFYILITQSGLSNFHFSTFLASILFFNAWVPGYTYPHNNWAPVPGGWSISVEFAFYLIFPLLMTFVKGLRSSLWFLAATLLMMVFAGSDFWHQNASISSDNMSLFLYYSPLNQLLVFSLGLVLYWVIKQPFIKSVIQESRITANTASVLAFLAMIALSFYGQQRLFTIEPFVVPTHFIISIVFFLWAAFLILKPSGIVLNSVLSAVGKMSFGIYLVHFASLSSINSFLSYLGWEQQTGAFGIAYLVVLSIAALAASYVFVRIAYRFVEEPCIRLGHQLANRIGGQVATQVLTKETLVKVS